jgi:hypothetical protein
MLRNIEQHTRQKIRVESVPTVFDLRAKQLEATSAAVRAIPLPLVVFPAASMTPRQAPGTP